MKGNRFGILLCLWFLWVYYVIRYFQSEGPVTQSSRLLPPLPRPPGVWFLEVEVPSPCAITGSLSVMVF